MIDITITISIIFHSFLIFLVRTILLHRKVKILIFSLINPSRLHLYFPYVRFCVLGEVHHGMMAHASKHMDQVMPPMCSNFNCKPAIAVPKVWPNLYPSSFLLDNLYNFCMIGHCIMLVMLGWNFIFLNLCPQKWSV